MSHLIEVAFKGNRKEFFLWDGDAPPLPRTGVIVDADRGEDLGRVHAVGELAAKRSAGTPHGVGDGAQARRALRIATEEELLRAEELTAQNEIARKRAAERVRANGLVMKLTDAEWQWDRKKLTFYFTAEKRVDFRALVRDLAAMFRTRIELKQIGVRDEARRLDGIGRCGRQYCSSSWLPELRPVNLGVAKDQKLSLNPTQISGACGRLMCCLRYEHEFYVQSRKRFPKEGRILTTSVGEEKVVANDIFNDRVTLRGVEGDVRVVPLADLRRELAERGTDLPEPATTAKDVAVAAGPPPRASHVTSRPDPLRSLPVVHAPVAPPAQVQEAARLLEQVAPAVDATGDVELEATTGIDEGEEGEDTIPGTADAADAADAADVDDADGGDETTDAAGGDPSRRPRRRRGRRGGRRGRGERPSGGAEGTTLESGPPGDSPDRPTTTTTPGTD